MNSSISYGRILLYHFIVGLIGVAVSLLIVAVPIYRLIVKFIMLINNENIMSENEFIFTFFIEIIGGFILYAILSTIIAKIFTVGLSYIPYLYKTNNLSLGSIFVIGFKKGLGVILLHVILLIAISLITFIVSILPIIGVVLSFGIAYIMGLCYLWLDYHVSRNALHGQSVFSHISFNSAQLFKRTKKEREVFILPLYYMAANFVGLGNLLIKPLFQLRIIKILEDEEQLLFTPPSQQFNIYPPPPPSQI